MGKVYYNSYLISLSAQGMHGTFITLQNSVSMCSGNKAGQMELVKITFHGKNYFCCCTESFLLESEMMAKW